MSVVDTEKNSRPKCMISASSWMSALLTGRSAWKIDAPGRGRVRSSEEEKYLQGPALTDGL